MGFKLILFVISLSGIFSSYSDVNIGKIINGQTAKPHSAPYIISLRIRLNDTDTHWCGGSLIRNNWVLTAAHCIVRHISMDLVAGEHDMAIVETGEQRVTVSFENIYVHEKYGGGTGPFDITLIRLLVKPFILTETVKVIAMPIKRSVPSGTATLFGWGKTSINMTENVWPHKLQTAENPVIDFGICVQVWADGPIHPTNICAGFLNNTNGAACNADSGGPLVQYNSRNEAILIGLVSWGSLPCAQEWTPTVFVRISAFIDWISDTIAKHS